MPTPATRATSALANAVDEPLGQHRAEDQTDRNGEEHYPEHHVGQPRLRLDRRNPRHHTPAIIPMTKKYADVPCRARRSTSTTLDAPDSLTGQQ